MKKTGMKLNLGCGRDVKPGFIGVDILKFEGVEVVHNLEEVPYPFEDDSVDEIYMDQVLEHLNNPIKVVEELYRIGSSGCKLTIGVPYFRSYYAFIDPTHVNFFSSSWFNYFDPSHVLQQKYSYSLARFKVLNVEYNREARKKKSKGIIKNMVRKYANKNPQKYDLNYSHLYPLDSLTFTLEVLK